MGSHLVGGGNTFKLTPAGSMPGRMNKGTSEAESGSEPEGPRKSTCLKTKPSKNYEKISKGDMGSRESSVQKSSSSGEEDIETEVNPVSSETVSSESAESGCEQSSILQHGDQEIVSDNDSELEESGDEAELNTQLASYKQNAAKMEVLELESQKRVKNLEKILLQQKTFSRKPAGSMAHMKTRVKEGN